MAAAKTKRERSVKDMLAGARLPTGGMAEDPPATRPPEGRLEGDSDGSSPVTKGFLTSLFDSLRSDIQDLRQDISQEMKHVTEW
ncbi:hypothetical protein NDU88_006258 [Pleurodeles waltl]|uniref:Uncharacterized protein n=1 Tax=Pleurodeles waltl TaxID=8319 RepID=A0AAV7NXL0_PLEWA|nr:hypothetical protein NDU88_006258 [Pleurodeles waltl]